MNRTDAYLAKKLDERTAAGNLRKLKVAGKLCDFYSNDYLGIATNCLLEHRLSAEVPAGKATGSTGSRLLSGNTQATVELEASIASFHQAEAALLFNSGYNANTGLLACIAGRHTAIIYDELCHASIIDGVRLSVCARKTTFAHNDPASLVAALTKCNDCEQLIVVVESVYSMDGDAAPLSQLAAICREYKAELIVDEAHATGVFGRAGEGLVCALGLQYSVFARVHTFGKALGCHGAAVVGSRLLCQYLVNFARPFIYTTALPGHSVAAIRAAYHFLQAPEFDNSTLHQLIAAFRQSIAGSHFTWINSTSPIQAVVIGNAARATTLAQQIQDAGFQVNAILHPTVPQGGERLRVCLHMFNTTDQVQHLLEVINQNTAT